MDRVDGCTITWMYCNLEMIRVINFMLQYFITILKIREKIRENLKFITILKIRENCILSQF